MSYLDVPRLYFAGQFIADPSTPNNSPSNYALGTVITPADQGWNPDGTGAWGLTGCKVTGVTFEDGTYSKDPAVDPVIGAPVSSVETSSLTSGRLVDLDPDQQLVSEIWALAVNLGSAAAGSFQSVFETAAFADIFWHGGPGGQAGARAFYQSLLTGISWSDSLASPFLEQLKGASPAALSIKFNVDRYNAHNPALGNAPQNFPDPHNGMKFTHGRVVGSIGPAAEGEPKHFVAARLLRPTTSQSSVNFAPCLYDSLRETVVLDLGNSLPAAELVNQVMVNLGSLFLVLQTGEDSPPVLGEIDYLAEDWYPTTAGIVELPAGDAADRITSFPLTVVPTGTMPRGIPPGALLSENPNGSFVRADQFVYRLNPGDESQSVDFRVTRFGQPDQGQEVNLALQKRHPGLNTPAGALPLGSTPPTDAQGRTSFPWTVNDPGNPRPFNLDGQVYYVDYNLPGVDDEFADPNNFISAQVYSQYPDEQNPTWWGNVYDILAQYHQLYPVMAFIQLDDYDAVVQNADRIRAAMNLPRDDGGFMPVVRDLSQSKLDVINRWFEQGMPEGQH